MPKAWDKLNEEIVQCGLCPRLREHCLETARQKRAAFREETYWGRPVPNFGDPSGRLLLIGLAPAAHGANRTGRMFTGDRSGDFLYDALFRTGFASQPTAVAVEDGLVLHNCAITAAAHCAPPANKPTPAELRSCAPWLVSTLQAMPNLQVILCLGGLALKAFLDGAKSQNWSLPHPAPRFAHGLWTLLPWERPIILAGAYHPSQQNTFTGRLTMDMFLQILQQIRSNLT
jgi:uracil-DNA glycosylase